MDLFGISLFTTLIITRIFAHTLHDIKNYGTKKDKSMTFTGYLRKTSGLDIHHFHIGIIILIFTTLIWSNFGINNYILILFGISLSLILDQVVPFFNRKNNYFDYSNIFYSVFLHIVSYLLI